MKSFSVFQLPEALHLRAIRLLNLGAYDELSRFYDLRDQARLLNPHLCLIEPLSMGKWAANKVLAILGLIGMLWIFAALHSQGLKTWGLQEAADAFSRYVQETGAAGMRSDLSNSIVIVLAVEAAIATVLPAWFFNWQNPVDKMVRLRLIEHEYRRTKSAQQEVNQGAQI